MNTASCCESNPCSCIVVSEAEADLHPARLYRQREFFGLVTPAARDREQIAALRVLTDDRRVVYAMRLPDGTIKIGQTINLVNRRNTIKPGPVKILAFMYGEHADEQAIHHRLKPHRARLREYYHPTPEVLDVVNEMRDQFGLSALGESLDPANVRST